MRSVDFLCYEGLTVTSIILGVIKWASIKFYKKNFRSWEISKISRNKLSWLRDFEKNCVRNFHETGQKPRKRKSFFQRKFTLLGKENYMMYTKNIIHRKWMIPLSNHVMIKCLIISKSTIKLDKRVGSITVPNECLWKI